MKSKDIAKKSKDENESKIKKIIIAIILFIIVLVLLFFIFRTPKYDIVFDSNGGTEISSIVVKKDGKITEPDDPVREGYSFKGWYYNDKLYDFSKPVTKDIELEARWEKIEKIESIKIKQDKLNLNIGDTDSLEVVITPSDAADVKLKWSSSDSSIVSVDENGKVTALKTGSATITVATDDGKYTSEVKVIVSYANKKPTVNKVDTNVTNSEVKDNEVENNDTEVDTEESDTIVNVTNVLLDETNISLNINDKTKLTATINPEDATDKSVTWTSSDSSVATVDADGNVEALKVGTAIITVKTNDGEYTAECIVNVSAVEVTGISLSQSQLSVEVGDGAKLSAIITPNNASDKNVTWSSSDSSVVSVDENGNIKALKVGTAVITVTTNDGGYTAQATVIVNEVSTTGVSLNKTQLTLMTGDNESLVATVMPADAADKSVTWSSSDSSVVSVDENGNIKALKVGTATITVTTNDGGYTAQATVNVNEEVDVDSLVEDAYDKIDGNAAIDKFVATLDGTDIEIMLIDLKMSSVEALASTGVATAVMDFLKTEGIKSVVLSYGNASFEVNKDNLDKDAIDTFLGQIGNSAADLVGKEINAVVSFEDGYKTANSSEFIITITEEEKVDVNSTLGNAYDGVSNKANDVFDAELTDNIIKVSLKKFNVSSVDALAGTGIAEAVISFLDTKGIEAVILSYGDASFEVNKNNLDKDAINAFFKEMGNSTADLVGKEITATVSFKTGYKTANINSFKVSFDEKKYDVNFYVDGSVVSTSSVRTGSLVTEINNPTKEGYTFDKWLLNGSVYDFTTPVTESIDLEASWTINSYKINIVSNDSNMGNVNVSEITVDYGTEIVVSLNTITIGDTVITAMPADETAQYTYTFDNWSNVTTPVVGDMTITANFSSIVNNYFVIYKGENGRPLGFQDVEYGTLVSELTAPEKAGYVAVGFVGVEPTTQITSDTTLVVKYAEELNVTATLGPSLKAIESDYYSAWIQESTNPQDNDTIITEFSSSDLIFSDMNFALEVVGLLETMADEEKYQSVKLSYNDDPTQQVELTGSVNIINVARFVGLVGAGSYSGELGLGVTVPQLVTATANKPITVTILLNDDYATPEGERTVVYDLVFTCKSQGIN